MVFSLAPEILGEEKNEREFLHGEHSFHSSLSSQFIVTKTDKYIWYSEKNEEQYFNLRKKIQEKSIMQSTIPNIKNGLHTLEAS